jgi:hypothetical protein
LTDFYRGIDCRNGKMDVPSLTGRRGQAKDEISSPSSSKYGTLSLVAWFNLRRKMFKHERKNLGEVLRIPVQVPA